MKCVVLQPSYLPWRGYFHQIQKADVFVFYDDVQYDRHGWRNRNRIKTRSGPAWLTIPLESSGDRWKDVRICDIRVATPGDWRRVHLATLRHCYAKAPFFSSYWPMLERWYESEPATLADFTIQTTIELARELGIANTKFLRSSTLDCAGTKTDRLLTVLQKIGATHYISGPAAKEYLDEAALQAAGISVEWMMYEYPAYPQLFPPYDAQLSALDLLLNVGPEASKFIWEQRSRTAGGS